VEGTKKRDNRSRANYKDHLGKGERGSKQTEGASQRTKWPTKVDVYSFADECAVGTAQKKDAPRGRKSQNGRKRGNGTKNAEHWGGLSKNLMENRSNQKGILQGSALAKKKAGGSGRKPPKERSPRLGSGRKP